MLSTPELVAALVPPPSLALQASVQLDDGLQATRDEMSRPKQTARASAACLWMCLAEDDQRRAGVAQLIAVRRSSARLPICGIGCAEAPHKAKHIEGPIRMEVPGERRM